jgi:hypothetical protein
MALGAVALYFAWSAVVLWQTYGFYRPLYLATLAITWVVAVSLAVFRDARDGRPSIPRPSWYAWCAGMALVRCVDVVLIHSVHGAAMTVRPRRGERRARARTRA